MDKKISVSPFDTCIKGHPTKTMQDFVYDNGNRRRCRKCVEIENDGKKRRKS